MSQEIIIEPILSEKSAALQESQRKYAFKVLKSRLYQLEKKSRDEKMQNLHDGKDDIAWGSQIRSYVLHPYRMVKDHRTDFEMGDRKSVV